MTSDLTPRDFLLSLPGFAHRGAAAYAPGFERINKLLDAMGNPHRRFRSVHVGGTNGKGSTSSMIAAILMESGLRVGLHTSPHLLDVTERMRVDGVPATTDWLDASVARYRRVIEEVGASFFEATVALSFDYFADREVDIAVVEVGLGGRLDATNVILPEVSVITNVSLEHTDLLGSTLEAIAAEKSGIVKSGVPVVTGITEPGPLHVVGGIARERGAALRKADDARVTDVRAIDAGISFDLATDVRSYGRLQLDLAGEHQPRNATTAVLAAEAVLPHLDPVVVQRALRDVRSLTGLRGRLEIIREDPRVVVDVSHNAEGIAAALRYMRSTINEPISLVLALMKDKDLDAVARVLLDDTAGPPPRVFITDVDSKRAWNAAELRDQLAQRGVSALVLESLKELPDHRDIAGHPVLIAGSHLLAAKALKA